LERLKPYSLEANANGSGDCRFAFRIMQLPEAKFYSITIGARAPVTVSRTVLDEQTWRVAL